MPALSLLSRRALAFGSLCFAVAGLLVMLSTSSVSAAVDDEDDIEFVDDNDTGRDWVFADDSFAEDEPGGSWSAPSYDSAGPWLSYARGFAPSAYGGATAPSAGSPATGLNDPAPGAREQSGDASWYSTTPGACAHRTVPEGTTITVTHVGNGKSTTCTVEGWGPEDRSRVIDLSEETFAALASPDVGVIPVRLTW